MATTLFELRDRIIADGVLRTIWNEYQITSPLVPNACTVESAIPPFHYETVTLLLSTSQAIVVQVPDDASRKRLSAAILLLAD